MKHKFIPILIGILILSLSFPSWVFSSQALSDNQLSKIEDRLRHVFQLQEKNVNNHLHSTYQSLDNFLFGPGINDKLLRYFNKHIKPGKLDEEVLWEKFRNEVLNKKDFLQFVDEMAEIQLRAYEKIRHETNREFSAMDIEGIPIIDFEKEKQKLMTEVSNIWNIEESALKDIISSTAGTTKDLASLERADIYVMGAAIATEIGSMLFVGSTACPPCSPVLLVASIAIMIGWYVYKDVINGRQLKAEMNTVQQRFMVYINKKLKQISAQTRVAFQEFSDKTYEILIKTAIDLIIKNHPQIRKGNLL